MPSFSRRHRPKYFDIVFIICIVLCLLIGVCLFIFREKSKKKDAIFMTSNFLGAPEAIRTPDPKLRRLILYPSELRARMSGALDEI